MALADQFNPETVAHEVATMLYQRMASMNLPEDVSQNTAGMLFEFAKIAGGLILEEPGLENPATKEMIPFDMAMTHQGIELFCEGLFHTAMKCYEKGLPNELKSHFMQTVAQEIYVQTKQIIISTYGQEATPEHQIPKSQQVEWINQTAENTLIYLVNEYEKQNGPIPLEPQEIPAAAPVHAPVAELPSEDPMASLDPMESMAESVPEMPAPPEAPGPAPKGPHPHDKYAAVALLLGTLRASHHETILRRFNGEERELIRFYQDPEVVEKNLDLTSVNRHLQNFKTLVKQGSHNLKNKAVKAMEEMMARVPKESVMVHVEKERTIVLQYLQTYFPEVEEGEEAPRSRRKLPFGEILPPKVEDVLYQYLNHRLEPQSGGGGG